MTIYASRNASKDSSLWRDEDIAMAHQHWGPFADADAARSTLVTEMREEVETMHTTAAGSSALDRAARTGHAADRIAAGADTAETDGLVWKIGPYIY